MLRFLLKPPWIFFNVIAALVVLVCLSLGRWQLSRLAERKAENARLAAQTALPPADLNQVLSSAPVSPGKADSSERLEAAYRRVRVEGAYDQGEEVVLLTRSSGEASGGKTGNHLLTPLITSEGPAILVDRGWVPLQMNEPPVAEAAPPQGPAVITGILLPSEPGSGFGQGDGARRAKAVPRVDMDRLSRQLPYPVYPLYLRLESQRPPPAGALPQAVPLPPPDEGPHLSYAVQWFAFATIAAITYVSLIRRERNRRRDAGAPPAPLGASHQ